MHVERRRPSHAAHFMHQRCAVCGTGRDVVAQCNNLLDISIFVYIIEAFNKGRRDPLKWDELELDNMKSSPNLTVGVGRLMLTGGVKINVITN